MIMQAIANAVNHPALDPDKHHRLITTAGRIGAWKRAGADDEMIVATIKAVLKTRPATEGAIRTWAYFDEPIRRAIADAKAMESFDAAVTAGPAAQRAKRSRAADAVLAELDGVEAPQRAAAG